MQGQKVLIVSMAILFALPLACAGKCPETMSKMTKEQLVGDDAMRTNALVERRQTLMDNAEESTNIERTKFSVTAYEQAIQVQVRIVNLAESSGAYDENIGAITDARCLLEKVLKATVLGGGEGFVSNGHARDIHSIYADFKKRFKGEGAPSKYDLKDVFENGVPVEEDVQAAGQEEEAAAAGEEVDGEDVGEGEEDEDVADEDEDDEDFGEGEDEEEEEEEESADEDMDLF